MGRRGELVLGRRDDPAALAAALADLAFGVVAEIGLDAAELVENLAGVDQVLVVARVFEKLGGGANHVGAVEEIGADIRAFAVGAPVLHQGTHRAFGGAQDLGVGREFVALEQGFDEDPDREGFEDLGIAGRRFEGAEVAVRVLRSQHAA